MPKIQEYLHLLIHQVHPQLAHFNNKLLLKETWEVDLPHLLARVADLLPEIVVLPELVLHHLREEI